ncbi:MAG TPA: alpha/beta hydrolase fold domain-containing protein [Planctomycetota bacterium]
MDVKKAAAFLSIAALGAVAYLGASHDTSVLAKASGNLEITRDVDYGPATLDLARPKDVARPRPALLMIHPGGWVQGDKSAYHALMLQYAELGYVTASVNFRPEPFPAPVDDCRRALRWLRENATSHGIDPARIGVLGWSSGAHLAALLALSDGGVQAVVGFAGVYDFLIETSGAFPNDENDPVVSRFLGGPPRSNPDTARKASPLHHLDAQDPPLLLFHGELDRRIDVEQARRFAAALKALGRDDEVILLPGVDHGRDVLPVDAESRERVRRFLARHLRPEK